MKDAGYRAFAEHFCTAFGAETVTRDGRLEVSLPPALAEHFGRPALVWTFTPHDPHGDLLAYGSQAFEDVLAYLGGHGRLAALRLPSVSAELPAAPRCLTGAIELLETTPAPERLHVFNFQLAFTCDERVERLYAVCLDEAGAERPEVLGWLDLAGDRSETIAAPTVPAQVAEAAEARAIATAETWVGPMEVAALARLEKLGERLVAYYEAQMREVTVRRRRAQSEQEAIAEADEVRWQLRRELERKLRDETARHQMRVQVRRISLAHVEVPVTRQVYRLMGARGVRELTVSRNGYTGEVHQTACERCAATARGYGVCAEGHLACAACLSTCSGCGEAHCQAELSACGSCGEQGCNACRTACAEGHMGCASHLEACSGCGQALCPRCERPHGCGLARS